MAQVVRFTLLARDLNITGGDNNRYWDWIQVQDTCSNKVVVAAKLIQVRFLDVRTKFDTSVLNPGTKYEVAFSLMMKDNAQGWINPVKLGLILNKFEGCREVVFSELKKNEWIEVQVGQFIAPSGNQAKRMEIYLSETKDSYKKGMILKGVVIRSKN